MYDFKRIRTNSSSRLYRPTIKGQFSNKKERNLRSRSIFHGLKSKNSKFTRKYIGKYSAQNNQSPEKKAILSKLRSRSFYSASSPHRTSNRVTFPTTPNSKSSNNSNKHSLGLSPPPNFNTETNVLARWTDGLFYLGTILKVDKENRRCFLKFEDSSEHWALFKDIQQEPSSSVNEIACCLCQLGNSEPPNEIVLCDDCGLGYHQLCHNPEIADHNLQLQVVWNCRLCIFAASAKKGGAKTKGPNAKAMQAMKKTLPYELQSLHWTNNHHSNSEQCYCYCGGPGDWYEQMFQCVRCHQWFHEACIQCIHQPLFIGDLFHIFICSICNHGHEFLQRIRLDWKNLVHLALLNLTLQNVTKYFDINRSILPWIEKNAAQLQCSELFSHMKDGNKVEKVFSVLDANQSIFKNGKDVKKKTSLWSLRTRIAPSPPKIFLPNEGIVTDKFISQYAQYKPSRKETEEIPLPSRNRVNKKTEARFHSNKEKRTGKVMEKVVNDQNVMSGGSTLSSNINSTLNQNTHEELVSRVNPTLDSIIPWPSSYEGSEHPFKTELERTTELHVRSIKDHILSSYTNGCHGNTGDAVESDGVTESGSDSTSLSHFNNENFKRNNKKSSLQRAIPAWVPKKKRGRKSRADILAEAAIKTARQRKQVQGRTNTVTSNVVDKNMIEELGKQQVSYTHLESSVRTYFGAVDRLKKGQKFCVLARRLTPDAKVQYLIQWEGTIS